MIVQLGQNQTKGKCPPDVGRNYIRGIIDTQNITCYADRAKSYIYGKKEKTSNDGAASRFRQILVQAYGYWEEMKSDIGICPQPVNKDITVARISIRQFNSLFTGEVVGKGK